MANVQSTNAILELVLKKHESRMESGLAAGFLPLEEITSFIIKLISCQHLTTITIDTLDEYNPQNRHELLDAISRVLQDSSELKFSFLAERTEISFATLKVASALRSKHAGISQTFSILSKLGLSHYQKRATTLREIT